MMNSSSKIGEKTTGIRRIPMPKINEINFPKLCYLQLRVAKGAIGAPYDA